MLTHKKERGVCVSVNYIGSVEVVQEKKDGLCAVSIVCMSKLSVY